MTETAKELEKTPALAPASPTVAPINAPEAPPTQSPEQLSAEVKALEQAAERGKDAEKAKPPAHGTMSKGEKLFSWSVYDGLNYWVNLASSVAIADYFCNLKGKKIIESGANAIAKTFSGGNASRHAKVFGQSQTALRTFTLLSGGWLLIVPIKMMEDNKRPIVHWLNKKMGVDQTGADGKELKPDEIYIEQEQPKQSWLNVVMRRTLATAAVMGTGQVLNEGFRDRNKTAAFKASHPTSKEDPHGGKSRVEKGVVDFLNDKIAKYVPNGEALTRNKQGAFQRYLALATLDTVFTKITAVIMKITNGAGKAQMPHEVGDDESRSASEKSLNHLQYVVPEYEDLRAKEALPDNGHAARIRNDQAEKIAGQKPKLFQKKPIDKAENFVSMAEKSDASPSIAG